MAAWSTSGMMYSLCAGGGADERHKINESKKLYCSFFLSRNKTREENSDVCFKESISYVSKDSNTAPGDNNNVACNMTDPGDIFLHPFKSWYMHIYAKTVSFVKPLPH